MGCVLDLGFAEEGKAEDESCFWVFKESAWCPFPPLTSSMDWEGWSPAAGSEYIAPTPPIYIFITILQLHDLKWVFKNIPMCYVIFAFLGEEKLLQEGG